MATELAATTDQEAHRKKKGLFGRLRRVNKNGGGNVDKRDPTPSPTQESNSQTRATEEVNFSAPSDDHKFDRSYSDEKSGSQMKQVRFPVKDAMKGKVPIRNRVELLKPPTAREAAFGGPPRYDWIDIETAAAIKVQSVFRRNQTMRELENDGITTAAIRNRSRRRQARMDREHVGSADIPNLFACCGVGLAFGDATEEDYEATRQHQKDQYLERKKEKEAKEEELRVKFQKMAAKKKAARRSDVEEVFEVVEE